MLSKLLSATFVVLLVTSLCACNKNGSAERAGEKVDNAAEVTGDKIENTMDKAGGKLDSAGNKIEDKTDK